MKNLLIIPMFLLLIFSSCTKDDIKPENIQDKIIGTWKIDKVFENGVDVANGCDKLSSMTFNADGSFTIIKKVIADIDCTTVIDSGGTWTSTNNNYTIEFTEGGIDMPIKIEGDILIEGAISDFRIEWIKP